MTEEERKDYLKYIENYTINDLADEFNTQNFVIQDKDKFNEILLYYHFKQNEEIEQLQQENQSLKKENKILRENAEHNDKVVDKVNWENQKLKKELEEYKLITIDYQDLEARNQKLKEQVDYLRKSIERKEETIIDLQNERVPYTNEYVCKLENQQKEFIEYLENEKNIYPYDISDYTYEDIINTILSKYYEIIDK